MRHYITLFLLFLMSGCAVGPNFTSPKIDMPTGFRGDTLPPALNATLPDAKWWERFGDKYLDTLITKAIAHNKDVLIAGRNVEIAKLKYRNSRSSLAPSLGLQLSAEAQYSNTNKIVQSYSVAPTISWEPDIFGGGRRLSESSRASSLAASYQYNGALLSVISSVAENYLSLLEYKVLLEISRKSYATRMKSYELMLKKFEYGVISKVDLNQSLTLLLTAQIAIENYKNAITEVSTALSVLIGENPRSFYSSNFQIFNIIIPSLPPTIMPAWVIDNRPDIQSAYYEVWSANAQIGVAVSRRFPTLSLNANGGLLYDIVRGSSGVPFVWNGSLSIAQSLLNFGINRRNVTISRAEKDIATLQFEKTVITAFAEVENAISKIGYLTAQEQKYNELVNTTFSINAMTNELYNKGSIDYLSVLDSERSLFDAQTQYTTTLTEKLISYVSLYKAIGGGW